VGITAPGIISFAILGCLVSAQPAFAQQPRILPNGCVQMGASITCADPSKSVIPGYNAPPSGQTTQGHGRVLSNGCVKQGDLVTCPPPSEMNIPGRNVSQAAVDPAEMATQMRIPANLPAEQLYETGARYNARRQYPQAAAFLYRCAQLNDPRCETALGLAYFNAKGVQKDVQKAVKYVGKGAYAGNRGAQYEVGYWYDEGEIVPHDAPKAFSWYMKSAQQNFATAQTRVGIAYEFGDGVPRNRQLAIQWLIKAANQGDGFSHVLADTLRNPRTPARFQNEDALAAYMRSSQTAAIGAAWPKVSRAGGISNAIDQLNRRNAETTLQAQGHSSAAEQCHNGGSCP
jgi:TPR repeat protein